MYHIVYLHFLKLIIMMWLFTYKPLEMYGCVLSTVATDALVPKHQAISTHSAD